MRKSKPSKSAKSANLAKARRARRRRGPLTADTPLTLKEARFIDLYLVELNGADAARKAGWAKHSAAVTASQLLTKPNVAQALADARRAQQERTQIRADNVLRELAALFFEPVPNVADLFVGRNLRPLDTLSRAQTAMIASFEIVEQNLVAGDGKTEQVRKVKVWDIRASKRGVAELLMRHLGLLEKPVDERPPVPAFALPADTPGVSVH